jgi:hypothetical protein
MRRRCFDAAALGPAQLPDWRVFIMQDGYASIRAAPGSCVYGVLWRLSLRDWAALNAYESLDSGLYKRRVVTVNADGRGVRAIAYVARSRTEGRARPGYQELVVAAAREWRFPADYVRALERWAPSRIHAARLPEPGEVR